MATLVVDDRAYEVEALLFDKDGTLFDFAVMWGGWADRLLDEVRAAVGAVDDLGRWIGWDGRSRRYDPAGPLAVGSMTDVLTAVAAGLYRAGVPWHRAKEAVVDARAAVDATFDWSQLLHPVAGLVELLERAGALKLPVGVITADDTANAAHHLALSGLAGLVTAVVGDDAVSVGKPQPEPVLAACRALHVRPAACALFGDTAGDVRCGRLAGVGIIVGMAATPELAVHLSGAEHILADYRAVTLGPPSTARLRGRGGSAALADAHDLVVAADQRWLRLAIHHEGIADLNVAVTDPDGRVRLEHWGKPTDERVVVGPDPVRSSCGTVPGPVQAGTWRVEVVGDAGSGSYTVAVDWGGGDVPEGTLPPVGAHLWDPQRGTRRYREGRCWYRGDFHAHTRASDGQQTAEALTQQARERGLDFFTITEHNVHTTGWPADDLLVVPGIEVTSARGHFNAIGVQRRLNLRGDGMNRPLADTRAQGAVTSLNHPLLDPWRWRWSETALDAFDCLEIWNDPTWPDNAEANESTLRLWSRLWDDGHRIVGIGGSDTHLLPGDSYVPGGPPSLLGDPWTAVFADGLSVVSILDALRAGRVYVSRGPVLRPVRASGRLVVDVEGAPHDATLQWVGNGGEVIGQGSAIEWESGGAEWRWARAEVRAADGTLLAVTNPFWSGTRRPTVSRWGDLPSDYHRSPSATA